MSKNTKVWLIAATALLLVGCIIFGGAMAMLKWDFRKLSTVKYETNTYIIDDEFDSISLKTNTADISFLPSDSGECKAVCYEEANRKHSVEVKDGTLNINLTDERKWYEYIGINIGAPEITVYLPKKEYTSLQIKESTGDIQITEDFKFERVDVSTSTGDIKVKNISANNLNLSVSTGKVTVSDVNCLGDIKVKVSTGKTDLENITCKGFVTTGSTGDIILNNVIASEDFSVKRSTGDVKFEGCDAAEISVKTDTGRVTGTLLSQKIFMASSDTGSINVPKTVNGGKCEIVTNTGDIQIELE